MKQRSRWLVARLFFGSRSTSRMVGSAPHLVGGGGHGGYSKGSVRSKQGCVPRSLFVDDGELEGLALTSGGGSIARSVEDGGRSKMRQRARSSFLLSSSPCFKDRWSELRSMMMMERDASTGKMAVGLHGS